MISVNLRVETLSPRKWYLNHSLNIFIIQDFYCDYFVLGDILTTGVIFESFIGNIQYSEHEVHYIHVNVKCLEDAFTTRLTLGFVTRYIQMMHSIQCILCGLLGIAETCVDLAVWESCVDLLWLGSCSRGWRGGCSRILRGCTHPTQHKSKFWLCDLGGVAVVKIGEFLCDPGRSW